MTWKGKASHVLMRNGGGWPASCPRDAWPARLDIVCTAMSPACCSYRRCQRPREWTVLMCTRPAAQASRRFGLRVARKQLLATRSQPCKAISIPVWKVQSGPPDGAEKATCCTCTCVMPCVSLLSFPSMTAAYLLLAGLCSVAGALASDRLTETPLRFTQQDESLSATSKSKQPERVSGFFRLSRE